MLQFDIVRFTLVALGQSYNCSIASKVTLKNMGKLRRPYHMPQQTIRNNDVHIFRRLYAICLVRVKRAVIDEIIPNPAYNQIRYPLNLLLNIPLCLTSIANCQAMTWKRRPLAPALLTKISAKYWCNSIPCCITDVANAYNWSTTTHH